MNYLLLIKRGRKKHDISTFLPDIYKLYAEVYPEQEAIMRNHFGSSPPSVFEAERNKTLLIISSNFVFSYAIPLMPSVVTTHILHVKTTNDPLPNVSNRYSLSLLHNICRLCLSSEYITDYDNSLAVKHV